ncbi:I78 family peptidase inhibitor [Loktanella sp. DJP18]|uniref:I78 family peptidase inhibitor n=1 Tax=Loktanella sp. DJP18 TaxID=3409788 RepID=UPI003BB505F6
MPLTLAAACGAAPALRGPIGTPAQPVDVAVLPSGAAVENSCGAQRHASLLGKDATVLETVLILGPVQVLRPGSIAAQDVQPDRINFVIGSDNRIANITCG